MLRFRWQYKTIICKISHKYLWPENIWYKPIEFILWYKPIEFILRIPINIMFWQKLEL